MDAGDGRNTTEATPHRRWRDLPALLWGIHLAMQDMGSTPGPGTKILHAEEQLSLHPTTREPVYCKKASHMTWQRSHCYN